MVLYGERCGQPSGIFRGDTASSGVRGDTMGDERSRAMVLRDAVGNYYVLPLEVVERARVPVERQAELEAALDTGEVSGYAMVGAVGGGIMPLDGSYVVDEETDAWPLVIESPRSAGLVSALRMLAGTRF